MSTVLGYLLQLCGWAFVGASAVCPMMGLFLVLARASALDGGFPTLVISLLLSPLVMVPLAIPLVHGGGVLRRQVLQRGICHRCGYDLRGGGGRACPECGTE